MSEKKKRTPRDKAHLPIEETTALFERYIKGDTITDIAAVTKHSRSSLHVIADHYKWKERKAKIIEAKFNQLETKIKNTVMTIDKLLTQDLERLVEDVTITKRNLTKEERDHLRALYDKHTKDVRLNAGKPTGDEVTFNAPTAIQIVAPKEMADAMGIFMNDKNKIISEVEYHKVDEVSDKDKEYIDGE